MDAEIGSPRPEDRLREQHMQGKPRFIAVLGAGVLLLAGLSATAARADAPEAAGLKQHESCGGRVPLLVPTQLPGTSSSLTIEACFTVDPDGAVRPIVWVTDP